MKFNKPGNGSQEDKRAGGLPTKTSENLEGIPIFISDQISLEQRPAHYYTNYTNNNNDNDT